MNQIVLNATQNYLYLLINIFTKGFPDEKEKIVETFLGSLSFNPAHSYSTNSSRKLLKDRYFAYLDGLESGKTTIPDAFLSFQLKKIVENGSIPYAEAIYQDISTGGKKHQKLLEEDSTCLERLKNTANTNPLLPQQAPIKEIKSGISFWERNTIYYGPPPMQPLNPEGIMNTQGFENKPDRLLNANERLVLAQLESKGLTIQTLLNLYDKDEFSAHHAKALLNLVAKGYPLIRALRTIDGLSPEQAEGISNGLERQEILQLNTWWEGKALVELKHEGLTAKMLGSRKSGGCFFEESHYKTLKLLSQRLTVWEALEKMDDLSVEDVEILYQQELNEHPQPSF